MSELEQRLPELRRLEFVLDNLPDEELVAALEARRGWGRDEYPVRPMWCALVAGVVFGHASAASLLRELGRNPALLGVCGFDPPGRQAPTRRRVGRTADGARTGGARGESAARRGADGVGVLALRVERGGDGGGDRGGVRDGRRAARSVDGGGAGFRTASGLRRQGGAEPFDGADERGDGAHVGCGRGLGEARDARRRRQDGPVVDEGEDVVRLRPARDRGRGTRDPGVVRGDGGGGGGAAGAVGGRGTRCSRRSRRWRSGARTSAPTGGWTAGR